MHILRDTAKVGAIAFLASMQLVAPSRADALSFDSTTEYSSGHYGDPQTTDEFYQALTGKYEFGDTIFKVTVPYLYVVGPSNVVPDFGQVGNKSTMQRTARDGLGDIIATLDEEVSPDSWADTDIDVIGKVKFATASSSRNLGTGENDYYAQLEWTQRFPYGISTVVGGGRRFVESSSETGLHDVWYGSLGTIWHASSTTSVSAWLDMRQSSAPTNGDQIETTLQVSNKFATDWKITIYGSKGFASGSPDYTGGLILSRAFSL